MKKIIAGLAVLALSLLVVKPVLAQEAIAVDFNGGLFIDTNSGFVINTPSSFANSGFNSVDEEGSVTTNSATADTDTTTALNSNSLIGGITDTQSGPTAYNLDTDDEDALAVAVDANLVGVINFNFGFVSNTSLSMANSGFNQAGEESTILTGSATSRTKTETDLNSNVTDISINDSGDGSVAFNEDGDASGTAVAADVNGVLVVNANMGSVCDFSFAGANSGVNITEDEEGTITTLGALATTQTTSGLNSNTTDVDITDSGEEGPVAANVDFDECNLAVAIDVNAVLVFNNNLGSVLNVSVAAANTGMNNGGEESTVTTGSATAGTTTTTNLNTNTTSVSITDNSNGPVAVNTDDDCEIDPCNPQIPSPCEEDACGTGCGGCPGGQGQTGPVAANVDTDGGVAVAIDANIAVVDNDNRGLVGNTSVALANSGGNQAGEESSVTTGNANAGTGTTNTVNSNDTTIVITDGATSGPVAVNQDSEDSLAVSADVNAAVVSNNNSALVTNQSTAVANTGNNGSLEQEAAGTCGTGCGEDESTVTTGNATATTTTTNNVNSNTTTFTISH